LIDYARTQKKSIVFVTDDGKKDWWVRDTKGKPIKPLPALVQEMFVEAGVLLHMYQGYEFLEQAAQFLKLEEKPEVIADAKEVTEQNIVEFSLSKLKKSFNPYKTRDEWIEYITSNLQEAVEGEASLEFYAEDVEGYRQIRILCNQDTIYSLNINKGGLGRSDDGISFSYAIGRMISISGINAWGHFKWDATRELVVLELHDLSLLSSFISGDAKEYTQEEFLEAIWDKIRSVID
jgi:PIN like domain